MLEYLGSYQGTSVCFSGYQGTERDVICHIAEIIGAVCQDYFVRKAQPRKKLQANTHLVVNGAEGSKYEAALKWNIPAVDKRLNHSTNCVVNSLLRVLTNSTDTV